ncbi:hypothetical protein, partial [Chryseosolibacter indicus]
ITASQYDAASTGGSQCQQRFGFKIPKLLADMLYARCWHGARIGHSQAYYQLLAKQTGAIQRP